MEKTVYQMREEILSLKSKKEVVNYLDEHSADLEELRAESTTHINLLCLAEVCGGIPGSFEFAMSNLRNQTAL